MNCAGTCSGFIGTQDSVSCIEDHEAILAANRTYYEAFENRDMDAMSDLWEHSSSVVCTHPGWVTLQGWSEVAASFFALFNNSAAIQFVLTEASVDQRGDTAWVVVDENILGEQVGATVSAMNLFVKTDDEWNLVVHHASLVSPADEDL